MPFFATHIIIIIVRQSYKFYMFWNEEETRRRERRSMFFVILIRMIFSCIFIQAYVSGKTFEKSQEIIAKDSQDMRGETTIKAIYMKKMERQTREDDSLSSSWSVSDTSLASSVIPSFICVLSLVCIFLSVSLLCLFSQSSIYPYPYPRQNHTRHGRQWRRMFSSLENLDLNLEPGHCVCKAYSVPSMFIRALMCVACLSFLYLFFLFHSLKPRHLLDMQRMGWRTDMKDPHDYECVIKKLHEKEEEVSIQKTSSRKYRLETAFCFL